LPRDRTVFCKRYRERAEHRDKQRPSAIITRFPLI
jgi:hypothetical protein